MHESLPRVALEHNTCSEARNTQEAMQIRERSQVEIHIQSMPLNSIAWITKSYSRTLLPRCIALNKNYIVDLFQESLVVVIINSLTATISGQLREFRFVLYR